MNLYQKDGRRKKATAHDAKHTISSFKHGGGNVIDDVTANRSSRMNSKVYKGFTLLSQPIASKLIVQHFTVKTDKDLKHTSKAAHEFPKAKWDIV